MKIEDIKPAGHRILIKTEAVETTTKSGIITMTDNEKIKQEAGNVYYEVVAMGPDCFNHESFNSRWCEVGDIIMTVQYPGQKVKFDGFTVWFINDDDILAKLEK